MGPQHPAGQVAPSWAGSLAKTCLENETEGEGREGGREKGELSWEEGSVHPKHIVATGPGEATTFQVSRPHRAGRPTDNNSYNWRL